MPKSVYPLFCPVAMASELLEPRWTMLVLCEMWSGSSRFNEIHRGVPGMSPGLLSKRLKDLETKGLVFREGNGKTGNAEYFLTPMAEKLEPIVRQLGEWAHSNLDSQVSLSKLDARMLMWNIRRSIKRRELPNSKCVIQFTLKEDPKEPQHYWLVFKPGEAIDLCFRDPHHNVDLFIVAQLRALTSAWMGHSSFASEVDNGDITLIGHNVLARTMTRWLTRSGFANVEKCQYLPESAEQQSA